MRQQEIMSCAVFPLTSQSSVTHCTYLNNNVSEITEKARCLFSHMQLVLPVLTYHCLSLRPTTVRRNIIVTGTD